MNDNILYSLKEYGLDENESNIYLQLVKNKELTAYQIAKDLHIHRSNCYNILDRLITKGFVYVIELENKKTYLANDLTNVLGKIKNKESILLSLMPELEKLKSNETTTVKHVKNLNSFSEFNIKLYELAKKGQISFLYMISNSPDLTTRNSRLLHERLLTDLKKTKILKNVDGRAIWNTKFRNHNFMQQFAKLGKNKFLKKLPNEATTFIYDGHVVFAFLEENDSFIEIKNKMITTEMKAYFEYLWELAEK
ncbi:MAG: helix-turn-helix domain-containing protein [Candidatus Woesearchaeota archaeon]|jgi:sugar-specific transcriptional regulator TrmB